MAVHQDTKRTSLASRAKAQKKRVRKAFQIAALVHRWSEAELEILLVTSRETHRWILPKGWPIAGKTGPATAEQEADEEAGVLGRALKRPIGRYSSHKRIGETALPCEVEVYALRFVKQKQKWKERGQRSCLWLPAEAAAEAVAEPELAAIISAYADAMRRSKKASRSA